MVTLDMRRAPDLAQRPGSDWWSADVKLDGVRLFWHGLSRSKTPLGTPTKLAHISTEPGCSAHC